MSHFEGGPTPGRPGPGDRVGEKNRRSFDSHLSERRTAATTQAQELSHFASLVPPSWGEARQRTT